MERKGEKGGKSKRGGYRATENRRGGVDRKSHQVEERSWKGGMRQGEGRKKKKKGEIEEVSQGQGREGVEGSKVRQERKMKKQIGGRGRAKRSKGKKGR